MLSGFLTGGIAALIYTPIEFAKIQCQISRHSKKGSVSLMLQLLTEEKLKGLKQLYTGLGVTMTK